MRDSAICKIVVIYALDSANLPKSTRDSAKIAESAIISALK
ncbi:hypothetical protein ACWIUD_02755 [Helicobacter sp. 23-1044]